MPHSLRAPLADYKDMSCEKEEAGIAQKRQRLARSVS